MRREVAALAVALLVGAAGPLVVAEPAAPAVATFVALTPTSGLVHDDPLTVRGQGFAPDSYLAVAQCRPTFTNLDASCDRAIFFRARGGGGFTIPLRADVVLDLAAGPRDCRTQDCQLVLFQASGLHPFRRIPLHYRPDGPDPFRPDVTVSPATELVDGDLVHVTGDALPPGAERVGVWVRQCVAPGTYLTQCDNEAVKVLVQPSDPLDLQFEVDTRVFPWADQYDCRAGGCVLYVGSRIEASEAVQIPLAFDPSGPIPDPPSVTTGPTTDLADGDVVDVTVHHFEGNEVDVRQCAAGLDLEEVQARCEAGPHHARPVDGGEVEIPVRLVLVNRNHQPTVDCRVEACVLRVAAGLHGPAVEVPLSFVPDAQPLRPRLMLGENGDLATPQEIPIHGSGLTDGLNELIWVRQCVGEISIVRLSRRCDYRETLRLDVDGPTFDETFLVRRRLATADGPVDCRVRRCRLLMIPPFNNRISGTGHLRFAT